MEPCTPFTVAVPDDTLVDLRERLGRTRFIDEFEGSEWDYGVSRPYLRELCEYWRTTFDWRAQEALLNAFEQFQTRVDGSPSTSSMPGRPIPAPFRSSWSTAGPVPSSSS